MCDRVSNVTTPFSQWADHVRAVTLINPEALYEEEGEDG